MDTDLIVYNHVLRLDLNTLQWELVDNYGDIPGVRMGSFLFALDTINAGFER